MNASQQDLFKEIDKIYDQSSRPLYLAQLGEELKKRNVFYERLTDSIAASEKYSLVRHPQISAKVAIARKGAEEEIRQKIIKESQQIIEDDFFSSLPRAFLYAFCQNKDVDTYLSLSFPIKFFSEQDSSETRKFISPEYKVEVKFDSIECLSVSEKEELKNKIKKWCSDNSVELNSLRIKQKDKKNNRFEASWLRTILSEDLVAFIQAQPDSVQQNLVIPLKLFYKK